MAKGLLTDALWLRIAPLIPPEAPKPVLLDIQLVRTVNLDSRALPLLK